MTSIGSTIGGRVPPWALATTAIERIPLGTAVAVEFLGRLTVAALRSHSRQAPVWPAVALVGVVTLTEPGPV